ncbi:MAG: hypothetical protein JW751_30015 [Polyangiaceae bacterium]|nr:hypothetical protein [Polyangiaceae bacterium]
MRWLPWAVLVATVAAGGVALWMDEGGALGPRVSRATFRSGTVLRASGNPSVGKAETCDLWGLPTTGYPQNCRLEVRCRSRTIYGERADIGYAQCEVADGIVLSADESALDDDDPDVHYDRATGRVVVREPGSWEVELALE